MDTKTRWVVLGLALFGLVVLSGPFMMGGMMGPSRMWSGPMGEDGWHWGMGWGGLVMLAVWGLVALGAVWLVRGLSSGSVDTPTRETPVDIVRRRYAEGELTREQYEQMGEDLEKG